MHSRAGLITEYLGEEWFDLINAGADEGECTGMEAWLYDEDRWPSGSAGGMVTADPQYRMKSIVITEQSPDTFARDDAPAAFAREHGICVPLDGKALASAVRAVSHTPISVTSEDGTPAENVFVQMRDFGVRLNGKHRTITTRPDKLRFRNTDNASMPFYTGELNYLITSDHYSALNLSNGERVKLTPTAFFGGLIRV